MESKKYYKLVLRDGTSYFGTKFEVGHTYESEDSFYFADTISGCYSHTHPMGGERIFEIEPLEEIYYEEPGICLCDKIRFIRELSKVEIARLVCSEVDDWKLYDIFRRLELPNEALELVPHDNHFSENAIVSAAVISEIFFNNIKNGKKLDQSTIEKIISIVKEGEKI